MRKRRKEMQARAEGVDTPLNAAMASRQADTLKMATEAVKHRQCVLAYQPVMQARAPHGVAFYEGLIRVLDETGRIIPARHFMPVVESSETGRELDCVALALGLRALLERPELRLSINMSARSIGYRRWMAVLKRYLRMDPSLGERLILEISESSAMTVPELVTDFMDQLQPHGIAFALDDFGSGALKPRHFRDFYFDAVKIDGQFVRGLGENPDNLSLVRALLAMAREFDMLAVAVSVETQAQAETLVAAGVDCLQGYLFGAPSVRPPWEEAEPGKRRA
ncbi:EAL domain, c-di-GMP-specific phosphodiesterase class I (or its enzymatically inactive variant) [Cribrihabitans marinus]|uniref:EAL domain, c-di-GMP-specific phosphodiesterase class I (Or its enzymatically inactive variant) n=1 Tax=Cribrihabitans marinus TaxID=1227549 RepID=A0A1H7CEQ3_9RHOB|nr:EAL domain-containing protein [Cribrihabitans marinus]GGH35294.1 diguanylate phosphodiesterase [Cribrihabitans marinus]SEJ88189.1 EAL domain, c-di-GMP-specific phosphodiesterase class I (or its enzymatically inactive variant) [Cribrihabitans marinus]